MRRPGILSVILVLAACSGTSSPTRPAAPTPTPTPPPVLAGTARYRVTFEATWSASTHPQSFPGSPHFSDLVGATHVAGLQLWAPGMPASAGIEAMAETGSTTPLDLEIGAAQSSGNVQHLLKGGGVDRSPGTVALEFPVGAGHPQVTLVSMLAPSPDWFVGVTALPLSEGATWRDEVIVELTPWDAGTDSGASYESPDSDTTPRGVVAAPPGGPLRVGGEVRSVGRFVFRRLP